MSPSDFRELVSGRRRGPGADALRLALAAVEIPYRWAVARRNRWFDAHPEAIYRPEAAVVSVGNLTLGGTGKTPMVAWAARFLADRGRRVCLISRGYGAKAGRANDEALELAEKLPGVPHVQNPDRSAAARQAAAEFVADALVLDDAFQHRRIARDVDIVLLDALEPFGFGRVFPRGTLREPVEGLRRADAVALSRAELLSADARTALRHEVARIAPGAAWAEVTHAPCGLLAPDGSREPLEFLSGRPIAAFCGLGNPAGFRHTLEACGYGVAGFREFPDHHAYTAADVAALTAWRESLGGAALVCTHKDLVKLRCLPLGEQPIWALEIGIAFLAGQAELEAMLAALPAHRHHVPA